MRDRAGTGRGERSRVAQRVRELLDGGAVGEPDQDTEPPNVGPRRAGLRYRFDPGRRSAAVIGAVVGVVAIVTAVWVFSSRPRTMAVTGSAVSSAVSSTVPAPAVPSAVPSTAASTAPSIGAGSSSPVSSATTSPSAAGSGSAATTVVVDVAGKVHHPGLYSLAPGSRVDDAVRAAGGALAGVNLISLDLASMVSDGEQIVVGLPATAGAPAGSAVAPSGSAVDSAGASGPVDLNTATLEQLETLPGIGPALGQRILDWRAANGSFGSVEQLTEVSGIGDVRFGQLRSLVTV